MKEHFTDAELRELETRLAKKIQEHAASHTISKPTGFTKEEMTDMFIKAGCGEVKWRLAEELISIPVAPNAKGQLFWACAKKTS